MHQVNHYPKFYHQRGKESDRDWVLSRMSAIPEHHQQRISDEYEKIYLKGGRAARKLANRYLNDVAREFHNDKIKTGQTTT